MPCFAATRRLQPLATLGLWLLASCGQPGADVARAVAPPPMVAALDAEGLPALVRGRVLLGELGCSACHDPGTTPVEVAPGPDLRTVGTRIEPAYLRAYLAAPHAREPGTVMPDLLWRWQGAERQERADALAAYLLSFTEPAAATSAPAAAESAGASDRGAALYQRIGCRACHDGEQPQAYLRDKYSPQALQAFLLAPHEARPSLRMPDFALSPREAHDLAVYLAGPEPAEARPAAPALAELARGRALFGELGCARCHALADPQRRDAPPPRPLAALDPSRGCLTGGVGPWPGYPLSEPQRAAVRLALAADAKSASDEQQVQVLLASRRCYACHRRGGVDAVTSRLGADLFGTDDASLGQDGKLPPSLDGVGARLQRAWLEHAVARGQRERPYLHVRMPGFGAAFAQRLTAALTTLDVLPPVRITPLPEDHEQAKPILELGRELVGERGMSCISCHRFAGEQAGAMGAIDLVYTTGERLRPEWFAHFMREPFRFKVDTLMPHFFPDGKSIRPQFADGDVQRQIDALWHYLAQGRNVAKPSGLRQPPIELSVGDEAVVLRRAVQGAGKRGIAVGYPGGVHVTFDAEQLGLNQIWWGRFVDARPVWTAQGSGAAQILSPVVALPNGPAFAVLAAADAPWPAATRRERGDRWLGYDLDAQRRPTFRYTAGDVTVADTLREQPGENGGVRLRRTLQLRGGSEPQQFRAAVHQQLQRVDEHTAHVGTTLVIRVEGAPWTLCQPTGQAESELRIALAPAGERTVVLEYSRQEAGR